MVTTLFELRQRLKSAKTLDEEAGKLISEALVRKEVDHQDEEIKKMKTSNLRDKFLNTNMKRNFIPRPSKPYHAFSDLDTIKDSGLPVSVMDGLGQVLTVNGFSVQSNFLVSLTIRIRGSGGLFEKDMHTY